jgi:hypothetical protein
LRPSTIGNRENGDGGGTVEESEKVLNGDPSKDFETLADDDVAAVIGIELVGVVDLSGDVAATG